jgi:hypothetical protein
MEFAEAYQAESTEQATTESQEAESNQTEQPVAETAEQVTTEATGAGETQATETDTPAPIKIKFNHEELEIPYEEATTLIQKGKNYDKIYSERMELQKKWEATQQQQEKQTLSEAYQSTVVQVAAEYGADPDALLEIAEKLVAKHPDVIESKGIKAKDAEALTKQQEQENILKDAAAFKKDYPDVDVATLPAEVWEKVDKGYSLTDAYQIHENKTLKEKIAAHEKAIQVKETNQKNAVTSPGSVTGNGATVADYISAETFDQNKGDQRWIIKNLPKIQESRKKWK